MIVKTEAVVLKSMKYRETSRIVTLYTRSFGKVPVIAKGARDRKNRFGAALQPMSRVTAVIYRKETRDLQLLSQCDLVKNFRHLTEDMDKMAAAMAAIEIVDAVTLGEEENAQLFHALARALEGINDATNGPRSSLYKFEVDLLDILGFRPEVQKCSRCGAPVASGVQGRDRREFSLSAGGVICLQCSFTGVGGITLSWEALQALQALQGIENSPALTRALMTPAVGAEVESALRWYLQRHVEGFRRLRSESVFSQVLGHPSETAT